MAVIAPSRSFDGSDLSTNVFGKIVKDGLRVVSFRDDRNKEGNFFFILPPYKADAGGRGVSWKVVPVRDNFGIDVKELFAVPRNCPIAHFASRAKQYYPDYAKVETVTANGRTGKRYPAFGRSTNKVLFNVAYMNQLGLGAHVLTLPQFGGAEHIEAWGRRRMPDGSDAPLLNDPNAAIPVFIQLKKDAIGMPWVVTPESSKVYKLPTELADASYLYDLDASVYYPEIDYLVDKLRSFAPTEIFNRCMTGYVMPNGVTLGGPPAGGGIPNSGPIATPGLVAIPGPSAGYAPTTAPAPAPLTSSIPRAVVPSVGPAPMPDSVPQVQSGYVSNPSAPNRPPAFSVEEARKYLQQPAGA